MNDLYILVNNEESGPFAPEELASMIENGEIPRETLYARPGMAGWETIVPLKADVLTEGSTSVFSQAPSLLESKPLLIHYESSGFNALMESFRELRT